MDLHAFESKLDETRRHPDVGYPVDWRRIVDLQVCRLRRFILGEVEAYIPFEVK